MAPNIEYVRDVGVCKGVCVRYLDSSFSFMIYVGCSKDHQLNDLGLQLAVADALQ